MTGTCGFCQKNYPRKIETEGDTCVLVTMDQVKTLNRRLLHRRYLMRELDTMKVYTLSLESYIMIKNSQIDSLLKITANDRVRIKNLLEVNLQYERDKISLKNKANRRKKWAWISGGVGVILGFFLAR